MRRRIEQDSDPESVGSAKGHEDGRYGDSAAADGDTGLLSGDTSQACPDPQSRFRFLFAPPGWADDRHPAPGFRRMLNLPGEVEVAAGPGSGPVRPRECDADRGFHGDRAAKGAH